MVISAVNNDNIMSVCDKMRSVEVLYLVASVCITVSLCEDREERLVRIQQGPVRGYKDPENDVFEFYGIPYASVPTGRHKFQAPLPGPEWLSTFEAVNKDITCPQVVPVELFKFLGINVVVQENCLVANVFVPDTSETSLPVVVYVHGGGFQTGNGLVFVGTKILSKKKFIMVTFNYRLGAHGFLCLGTEDIPGNAGMKDQVALLRWVNKNIKSFGGNPNDVTIWGSSAGSASVDLLMLSPSAKGLFNKVIPESGANLATFTVQTDPIANAKEYAKQVNFSDVDNIYALEEFYKTASFETLFTDDFSDRKDSAIPFSPCVETKTGQESFLEDSPFAILKSGKYDKLPILHGFANMEGYMRIDFFDTWKDSMNERFSDFLPHDLTFKDDDEKAAVSKQVKEFYFGNGIITENNVLAYIDYFTDVMFAYPTLRSIKLHVNAGHDKIYLYEYSYTYENDSFNSPVVPYTNNVRGANHCAQSAGLSDALGLDVDEDTLPEETKAVITYMRELWINFITTGNPVPAGSSLPAWPAVSQADGAPHMSLGRAPELRGALLERRARFWDAIYERHYRAPQPASPPTIKHIEL